MLGPKQEAQGALFYEFSIDDHMPQDHLLRSIDRFVDLSSIRTYLSDYYSHAGRPSIARQCIKNA
jgi:transposase